MSAKLPFKCWGRRIRTPKGDYVDFWQPGQAVALFSPHPLGYKEQPIWSARHQVNTMWLFTRWGFYNIACARQGDDGGIGDEIDPHSLVVEAFDERHLAALKSHLPDLIGNCFIKEVAESELRFHMIVEKNIWSQVMLSLSQELNYDDFREEMVRTHSMDDPAYLKAMTEFEQFIAKIPSTEESD